MYREKTYRYLIYFDTSFIVLFVILSIFFYITAPSHIEGVGVLGEGGTPAHRVYDYFAVYLSLIGLVFGVVFLLIGIIISKKKNTRSKTEPSPPASSR